MNDEIMSIILLALPVIFLFTYFRMIQYEEDKFNKKLDKAEIIDEKEVIAIVLNKNQIVHNYHPSVSAVIHEVQLNIDNNIVYTTDVELYKTLQYEKDYIFIFKTVTLNNKEYKYYELKNKNISDKKIFV